MPDQDSEKNDSYSMEDHAQGEQSDQTPDKNSPIVKPSGDVEPLELEDTSADDVAQDTDSTKEIEPENKAKSHVKGLDVCPNCGSTMRGSNTLLCMRCGFDLKTLQVIKTTTGEVTEEELDDEEEIKHPLCMPGRGDFKLPLIILAFSAALISIGYLIGADGLFTLVNEEGVSKAPVASERFAAWGIYLATLVLGTGCGLVGIFSVSKLNEVPFGDLKLASARMAAIIATLWLAKFVGLGNGFPELAAEWILHTGIFVGLSMVFFKLVVRDAITAAVATLIVLLIFFGIATALT